MVSISLNGVPPHQIPAASGLSNFARIVAGSFAASLATTFWDDMESVLQTRNTEAMGGAGGGSNAVQQFLWQVTHLGLSQDQAVGVLARQVSTISYLSAALDIFRLSAIVTLCLIPFIWMCKPTFAQKGAAPVAAD